MKSDRISGLLPWVPFSPYLSREPIFNPTFQLLYTAQIKRRLFGRENLFFNSVVWMFESSPIWAEKTLIMFIQKKTKRWGRGLLRNNVKAFE